MFIEYPHEAPIYTNTGSIVSSGNGHRISHPFALLEAFPVHVKLQVWSNRSPPRGDEWCSFRAYALARLGELATNWKTVEAELSFVFTCWIYDRVE